jgi:hypothetical protein
MTMLYSLGRESASAAEWAKVVGPILQDAREFPVDGFADFVGLWSKSVSYLGQSELHARRAERYEVFDIEPALASAARRPFEKYNAQGIEGLKQAKRRLGSMQTHLEEYDRGVADRDIAGELDEHRSLLFAELAEIEMKQSDARKLRDLVDEAIDTTKRSGLAGLGQWMDQQLDKGIEARGRDDRGAVENFAIWKLAAVIAILIALGIAFAIHCGWFGCSVYSRNNYIAAILTTAGLWWC